MDPRRFGFIEPPSKDALESAITALQKVGISFEYPETDPAALN